MVNFLLEVRSLWEDVFVAIALLGSGFRYASTLSIRVFDENLHGEQELAAHLWCREHLNITTEAFANLFTDG